tara:strand:- start:7 stop:918 length:912 start_codon:yes stop_codon:yes gene_type:complete
MPAQLSKLALVNTSALTETKTFSVIQEGAAEASRQVISIEANTAIIENNREIITSKIFNITLTGLYDSSTATQLKTWVDNRTNLVFTGFSVDGRILQAEGELSKVEGFEDNLSFRFTSPREAVGGYNSTTGEHTASMSYSKNGFSLYKWLGVGSPSRAANWTAGGTTLTSTSTFNSGNEKQRLKNDAATSSTATFTHRVYFPFPGKQLTAFVEVTDVTDFDPIPTMTITAKDNANNIEGSAVSVNLNSTGVKLATLTLPADTHHVEVAFNIHGTNDIKIKQPSLQITTGTPTTSDRNFEEFNT